MMQNQNPTKLVRVTLLAHAPVHYTEVIEVPADMSDDDLQALAGRRYDEIDPEEYSLYDDGVSWKKDVVECATAELAAVATLQLVGDELNEIATRQEQSAPLAELPPVELVTESMPCQGAAKQALPIVVIELDGGLVQCVRTSAPVEIIKIDTDVEGADEEDISEFMGTEAVVSYWVSKTPVSGGYEGMDPEYCTNAKKEALALIAEGN